MHEINIFIHILSGSLSLLLGLLAILSTKGGKLHNASGKYFLVFMSIVIFSGLIGVFVFGRNLFLLVITVLSGYVAFSGYRTLKAKDNTPNKLDISVAIISLVILGYYLYYFKQIGMYWSPIIIYSTVGALVFIVAYDILKYLIPQEKYVKNKIWLYEHIYKMMSAFSGLLSAFSGTVLDEYQPHSQYLPSVLGVFVAIGFMLYLGMYGLRRNKKQSNPT